MSYQGIFVRHYPGQQPGQTSGVWSASPDVIPTGASPLSNPNVLISEYNQVFGTQVVAGQVNYLYMRGLNTGGAPETTRFWLFYVPNNLMLWPQAWSAAGIMVNGEPTNFAEVTIPAGQVGATPPFTWAAQPLATAQAYSLIAIAENAPLSQPPQAPLPTQPFTSPDELGQWVSSQPNVGWLNTATVQGAQPTWQQVIPITGPADVEELMVGFACQNMPTDGYVAMTVPGPDAQNTVNMPKTPITNPNMAIQYQVVWPANYTTEMTLSYWQGATPPGPGASISPVIAVMAGGATQVIANPKFQMV